ncbi:putative exostosin [Lupinus albus]|uniref:Putative exostosin n=1 Tax=Lupinus albus TaxID=3870 RepID=A0A6A4R1K9_LUPAL|nr:putative exostosin [Lupinus albus]
MAEKNVSSIKVVSRKSLVFFFTMTSILFLMSWFYVLRSTGSPNAIDHNLLPNSKFLSTFDGSNSESQLQNQNAEESSLENRAILVDSVNVEETSEAKKNRENAKSKTNDDRKCRRNGKAVLKVFMYDLPLEFHFGLMDWKGSGNSVWPDIRTEIPRYPGGLNLQHSIEFWLTLDLLASEIPQALKPGSAIRVRNSSEADIIFVPFFSSLSYNRYSKTNPHEKKSRNKILQEKLVKHLTAQEEWKRSKGKDHLILAHHPNSMLDARMKLWPATFILSDFGRYPPNIANVEKDVIAPYKHVIGSYVNDVSTFDSRSTLLYFQGAIYRKDVWFIFSLIS